MAVNDVYEFGSGFLTGVRTDLGGTQTPRPFGTLQDVTIEFSGDIKELYGQLQYPVDTARGKTKISGKAKFAGIKAAMYNDIFFGPVSAQTTGQLKFARNEAATLPSPALSYTVANASSVPLVDLGVFYASGSLSGGVPGAQLTAVATAVPSVSATYHFNPATGVYSFFSADQGNLFNINYTYKAATGQLLTLSNQPMGNTPTFQATFYQQYAGSNPAPISQVVLVLNQCTSQRLTYPTRIDDYVIPEMDFSAFADGSGNIGTLSVAV
jgi:hypothetical protein